MPFDPLRPAIKSTLVAFTSQISDTADSASGINPIGHEPVPALRRMATSHQTNNPHAIALPASSDVGQQNRTFVSFSLDAEIL
jgi:hypothetical protein